MTKEDAQEIRSAEPCANCVNRQAVFDIVERAQYKGDALSEIEKLPPVTPAPKIGWWEYVQYDGNPNIGNWHCSLCRCICEKWRNKPTYNYCPNCGAKMSEEV